MMLCQSPSFLLDVISTQDPLSSVWVLYASDAISVTVVNDVFALPVSSFDSGVELLTGGSPFPTSGRSLGLIYFQKGSLLIFPPHLDRISGIFHPLNFHSTVFDVDIHTSECSHGIISLPFLVREGVSGWPPLRNHV